MWPDSEPALVVAGLAALDALALSAVGLLCYRAGDRRGARQVYGWWRQKEDEARAKRREKRRARRRRKRQRAGPGSPVLENGRRRCLTCGREEWHVDPHPK